MDAHVGEILDAIDELHIRDNTIVVFTSDNGPEATWPWQGSSGPWRGYYFTHMEGSLRVPFIVRWPDHVPAGRVSNEIVHEVDTYVTFAKIAGAQIPQDRPIDGVDQTDFLLGKSEKSNRDGFPVFVADRLEAVKWKNSSMMKSETGGHRPLSSACQSPSISSPIPKRNILRPHSEIVWNAGPAIENRGRVRAKPKRSIRRSLLVRPTPILRRGPKRVTNSLNAIRDCKPECASK